MHLDQDPKLPDPGSHNHPSGNLENPSEADKQISTKLREAS